MLSVAAFAETLSGPLGPVRDFIRQRGTRVLEGSYVAAHDPTVAPQHHAFEIWPGVTDSSLRDYERNTRCSIPEHYRSILTQARGITLGQLKFYGVPTSMLGDPPLLDRARRQPLDLATANRAWRREFQISTELFHFAGITQADTIIGCFTDAAARVLTVARDGERGSQIPRVETYEELIVYGLSTIPAGA